VIKQGGKDEQGMWHACERREMHIEYHFENPKE
jgi:hypothetical protein